MTPNFENVKAAVKRAYNEETRQLDFMAESTVTVNEAVEIMTEALELNNEVELGYGNFSPTVLRELPEGSMITLAREGSVCVYVNIPEVFTDVVDRRYKQYVQRYMKADEFGLYSRQNPRTHYGALRPVNSVRLWWD